MADVIKINGYIIKDANAPHPSNVGSAGQVLKKTETGTEWADAPVPDWNQNNSTAADYVKNRPFYTGDPVEIVLVEESTVAFTEEGGMYFGQSPSTFEATVGETYKISWDGTVYECTCVDFNGDLVLGNLSIMGVGSDTGEPFVMGISNGEGLAIYTTNSSSSHTFSISGTDVPVVKIDPKYLPASFKPEGKSYLTFSSMSSFTLAVEDATKHWDGTLEYFASDRTWTTWDGTTTLSSVDNYGEYVLYLRGTGNTVIIGNSPIYKWILTGIDIKCIGNIENLLDYETVESGGHPTMANYCYTNMFYNCTSLTQAPALPATTLATYCYHGMFYNCTSLTQAPTLPATTLADRCYESMFQGCTSLTQAPALPATTLATYCYTNMFYDCTSLTQAPALPATTLANYCYHGMFYNCVSLTQVPALPATTLAGNCYYNMFQGCTSLTQAPALPATTLAKSCYGYMFSSCTSITQLPALPATTLAESCYDHMFFDCTSLKLSSTQTDEYTQEYRIPSSGTGTTATDALSSMFAHTGGTFTGTPEINTTYYLSSDNMIVRETEISTLNGYVGSMIEGLATQEYVDGKVPNDGTTGQILKRTETGTEWADAQFKPEGKSYLTFSSPNSFTLKVNDTTKHWDGILEYFSSNRTWTAWDGTTTLSAVVDDGEYVLYLRGTGNTVITGNNDSYRWILTGSDIACTGNIENLLDYATVTAGNHPTMANYCYYSMFQGCTSLTQAPSLPATTLANYCYRRMFQGCTSLTQAPSLPAITLTESCYYSMFQGCTSLTQAPALPAITLAEGCYRSMFSGCTSLTQAPALPATTLAWNCYWRMFQGCTSLIQAPALPATTLDIGCYSSMFNGCTSLTQAPALPATTLADNCYQSMFQGCTSLTQAPSLPATTLANNCYQRMFQGCTSLTQAPSLPATTLADNCYQSMFQGCTSLKLSTAQTGEYTQEYRIPSSGTGTTAADALTNMFTSTGGTFTGTPEINTTYYLSSDNMVVRDTEIATLNGYVGSMIDAATKSKIDVNMKGAANGVASLGSDGKVPSAQLPKMGGEAYTATLTTSGWAQSGSRYSQTVNVTGVTASTPVVLVDVALSGTDLDADAAALEAWGIVSANNVAQGDGTLTFYALSVPSVNIPVNVGVC